MIKITDDLYLGIIGTWELMGPLKCEYNKWLITLIMITLISIHSVLCHVTLWLTPSLPLVLFGDSFPCSPPPRVSRFILMAPK